MDVLLDGGFGINIIFEHLWRKLSLKELLINAIHGKWQIKERYNQ
jgi:hypothetical protein